MVVVLVVLVLVALVAVGVQIAIPRIAAARVRDRLTERGGSAEVRVGAMPATRLLSNSGDRIVVRGRGLEIGMAAGDQRTEATTAAGLGALDGFDHVDIELVDFRTGPFMVGAFVLERSGGGSYAMATRATTTAGEIAGLGAEWLGSSIPGSGLLGGLAGPVLGSRSIELSVQLELVSANGRLRVSSGGGTIAGYPAGPLATTIAAAVARRLEIVP